MQVSHSELWEAAEGLQLCLKAPPVKTAFQERAAAATDYTSLRVYRSFCLKIVTHYFFLEQINIIVMFYVCFVTVGGNNQIYEFSVSLGQEHNYFDFS